MHIAPALAPRPSFWALLLPYWRSPKRWGAFLLLATSLALTSAGIYIGGWQARLQGPLFDLMIASQWTHVARQIILLVIATAAIAIQNQVIYAAQAMLALNWRTWMTEQFTTRWTANNTFYRIELDGKLGNADQRISEDIWKFTEQGLSLFINLFHAVGSCITFGVLLWTVGGTLDLRPYGYAIVVPGYMLYIAILYVLLLNLVTYALGKPLVGLFMRREGAEADFRHAAIQMRENAEQVAFYQGGAQEGLRLVERFLAIRAAWIRVIKRSVTFGLGVTTFASLNDIIPLAACVPRVVAGSLTVGGMMTVRGYYQIFSGSLGLFTQAFTTLSAWWAVSNRLRDMLGMIEQAESVKSGIEVDRKTNATALKTSAVRLRLPDGHAMTMAPALCFAPGERWLITGRSGTGKSTLLRALAGLWPHGDGQVQWPTGARTIFVPQRSYIPEGTLKGALCYPLSERDFSDAACAAALDTCLLSAFAPSLNNPQRWQQTLSGGEQQRLALARVLLQRPDFVFLDEATSALDPATEQQVYKRLTSDLAKSTIVSVAHRPEVASFHDHVLELVPSANRDHIEALPTELPLVDEPSRLQS